MIDWYIQVMEDGINAKDLCIELVKTKKLNKTLDKKIETLTAEHNKKMEKLTAKLEKTKHFLVKQNKEVVKPLMFEFKLSEEIK